MLLSRIILFSAPELEFCILISLSTKLQKLIYFNKIKRNDTLNSDEMSLEHEELKEKKNKKGGKEKVKT